MNKSVKQNIVWYIAGPMSWIPKYNVPAFFDACDQLTAHGYKVRLPVDLDSPEVVKRLMQSVNGDPSELETNMTWGECLALDISMIADHCGGVAVLPGWMLSRGARLETFTAYLNDMPIVYANNMKRIPNSMLFRAWKGEISR